MFYEKLLSVTMLLLVIILYYFSITKHLNRERTINRAEKLAANGQIKEAIELLEKYDPSYKTWLGDNDFSSRVGKIINQHKNHLNLMPNSIDCSVKNIE